MIFASPAFWAGAIIGFLAGFFFTDVLRDLIARKRLDALDDAGEQALLQALRQVRARKRAEKYEDN